MMPTENNFVAQLSLYQNANSDSASIKKGFVIRTVEFERIMAAIRNKGPKDPAQHELLLGRRGSGKSTLLKRLQVEIDETLSETHIAINTAEEQASIYRLSDLWYEVLQELSKKLGFVPELRPFSSFDNNQAYTRYLYTLIHEALQKHQRKAVLLLDNLDRIVENFDDDGHLLREILSNYNDLQIIGGSTRMDEHFWQYDKPFYEFFRRHRLEALSFDEISQLLNHWSEAMHLPQLKDYALLHRGKIETIRIMTDGLPRTLQFFIRILLQNDAIYGFDYLKKIMDDATLLYQERLNNLTAPQRKIVQEMAFLWEACATKQLIDLCRMEGKLISSYMKQLSQYGIVETIETNTKNHLYRLSERFFNMWLIVTQGNPDQKRKAKWLTIFLEAWYDEAEIQELTLVHLQNLDGKKIVYDKALVLTKALSQSRFVGVRERDMLIGGTQNLEDKITDETWRLPRTYAKILTEDIYRFVINKEYEMALQKIEEIENEADGVKFIIKSLILDLLNRPEESELNYQKGLDKIKDEKEINYLIIFFLYNTNKGKQKALEAVRRINKEFKLTLIIEIWSNILEGIERKIEVIFSIDESIIERLVKQSLSLGMNENTFEKVRDIFVKNRFQYNNLDWFLEHLLNLEQSHLVLSLFESAEHGKELRERYQLLYYATLLLLNRTENNLLLRIPPEVLPTVQGIVAQVREKQAFYGA